MKKIILIIFFLFISLNLLAESWTISDKSLSLTFSQGDKNIYLNKIYDIKNQKDFIKTPIDTKNLWDLKVNINGEKSFLLPQNAQDLKVSVEKSKINFTWINVKPENISKGCDIIATIEIANSNSYWHIKIVPSEEIGLCDIGFPLINDIDGEDGDTLMYPYHAAGVPIREFSHPEGFPNPTVTSESEFLYTTEIGYISPTCLAFGSFTKGNSSLYLSPEDKTFYNKSTHYHQLQPNHIDYAIHIHPDNYGLSKIFNQGYKFNMALVQGDWYDCAKKYRKWGIDNKAPAFTKGPIDKREDIPQWLKENVIWSRWNCDAVCWESVLDYKKKIDVNMATHLYFWSSFPHDTNYPDWLPAQDYVVEKMPLIKEAGIKVMPYLNGHLVDMALGKTAKAYGDEILVLNENGEPIGEHWSAEKGAKNQVACIQSPYYDIFMKSCIDTVKHLDADALYIDQIGNTFQPMCFNPKHSHPYGGGAGYIETYTKFLNELGEKLKEIKGVPVNFGTENVCEAVPFDLFVRCNDAFYSSALYPLANVIFSGYKISYGDSSEYELYADKPDSEKDTLILRAKSGVSLVSGNQFGWTEGSHYELDRFPKWATYFKQAAKAREAGVEYFNLGEVVRAVEFTNEIPTGEMVWTQHCGKEKVNMPLVYTGSFNYKGKTAIIFTNTSENVVPVSFKSDGKSLNLKLKKYYKISEIFPNKKLVSNGKIKGNFNLAPLETKVFVVE